MDSHIEDDGQEQSHGQPLGGGDTLAVADIHPLEVLVALLFDKAPARVHREVNASVAGVFVAIAWCKFAGSAVHSSPKGYG